MVHQELEQIYITFSPPYFSGTLEIIYEEQVKNNASRLNKQIDEIVAEFSVAKRDFYKLEPDKFSIINDQAKIKSMNLSGVDVKLMIYFGNGTALSRTDETIEVVIPFGGDLPLGMESFLLIFWLKV